MKYVLRHGREKKDIYHPVTAAAGVTLLHRARLTRWLGDQLMQLTMQGISL